MVNAAGQVIGMDTAGGRQQVQASAAPERLAALAIPIDHATSLAAKIVAGLSSSTIHIGATPFPGRQASDRRGEAACSARSAAPAVDVTKVVRDRPASRAGLSPERRDHEGSPAEPIEEPDEADVGAPERRRRVIS